MKVEILNELIKIIEKNNITSFAISFVVAIIIYCETTNENVIVVQLGKEIYILFLFCSIFIVLQFFNWIKKYISKQRGLHFIDKYNFEINQQKTDQKMENLWDFYDKLSERDRNLLKKFLKTKNLPMITRTKTFYSSESIMNSSLIKKQEGYDEQGYYMKYKLSDNFYKILEFSSKNYGKIGHFEEVDYDKLQ